jgi:uncharacterized protein involved in exopolysaccharide biosynthesis
MTERERRGDRAREEQDSTREATRALTARERLNRELDALEDSLREMRRTARVFPDDPHPGPHVPINHGGAR